MAESERPQIDIGKPKQPASKRSGAKAQFFETVPVKRKVRVFQVTESELNGIATGNTVSRWSASAGWSLFSFGAAVVLSLVVEGQPSELAKSLAIYVVPICLALGGVCFGVWYFTKGKRADDLASILCPPEEAEV